MHETDIFDEKVLGRDFTEEMEMGKKIVGKNKVDETANSIDRLINQIDNHGMKQSMLDQTMSAELHCDNQSEYNILGELIKVNKSKTSI